MSGHAYVDIVNMTVETSLQHMTTLTVSELMSMTKIQNVTPVVFFGIFLTTFDTTSHKILINKLY